MGKFHEKRHEEHVRMIPTLKGVVGMLRNPEGTMSIYDIEDGLRDIEHPRKRYSRSTSANRIPPRSAVACRSAEVPAL